MTLGGQLEEQVSTDGHARKGWWKEVMMISSELIFTLEIKLGAPVEVGHVPAGFRRVIPIAGGTFSGHGLNGTVLPGGADWNILRPDGIIHLWARYELRTNGGAIISVINEGFQRVDPDAASVRLEDRESMLTRPTFEVGTAGPTWLNEGNYAGELRVLPPDRMGVELSVYRLTSTLN